LADTLPNGEIGTLRYRIQDGVNGYLDDPATTARHFQDGHFWPGDLGELRADGHLCLHGRATEVINLLGRKLPTGPFERRLQAELGLAACILSQPDASGVETVHVVLEATLPVPEAAVAAALAELAAAPRLAVHHVAALPRNALGKVTRAALATQLRAAG
jgi:acyl-coenzyme A synthetase/AMP-(fatty) acid ligase